MQFRFKACSVRVAVPMLALALVALQGCTTPAGVEVRNMTGRTLKAEYLTVANEGAREAHGEAIVSRDSTFSYKVDQRDHPGNRVRFSVPDLPMDDMTTVEIALPEKTTRVYDLRYEGGHLVARQIKKGANLPWVKDRTAD